MYMFSLGIRGKQKMETALEVEILSLLAIYISIVSLPLVQSITDSVPKSN